jgi:acylphosphatase
MAAMRVRVTGRVQGVSFRYYAQQEAVSLGLTGWVRNEVDGSVELHLEGPRDAVDSMVDWCRQGPAAARVRDVAVREAAELGGTSFKVTG